MAIDSLHSRQAWEQIKRSLDEAKRNPGSDASQKPCFLDYASLPQEIGVFDSVNSNLRQCACSLGLLLRNL